MIRTLVFAAFVTACFPVLAAEEAKFTPDPAKAKPIVETVCMACHGMDGNSQTPANPILAGQGAAYLVKQLTDFQSADDKPPRRVNGIMNGMVATLATKEDILNIAAYFAQQKPKPAEPEDPKLAAEGQTLWRKGDFEKGIPSCTGCHGPSGAGIPFQYPRLAGQFTEYTEAQLKNFRSGERSNDPEKMMQTIADKLSDKQIKALAEYIASLR